MLIDRRPWVVRHLADSSPARFEVGEAGGETARTAVVPAADGFPVPPDGELMAELCWYLERFPEYPFPPATERSERVLAALRRWGETTFTALFPGSCRPGDDPERLRLRIVSDDPHILAWPWEALQPPYGDPIGRLGEIERGFITREAVPSEPLNGLPSDQIQILLITARHDADIAYRSVSRSLVELASRPGKQRLPVHIHLLRPPTLTELKRHLEAHPHTYHVLHFDGHGVYESGYSGGVEGHLLFEDEGGGLVKVSGRALGQLLRRSPVPIVVLNACRSAMLDQEARDAFAAVATALLHAGTHSVVAMAYVLYVSGAQRFLPVFYQRFFDTGRIGEAVSAGRRRMAASPDRLGARGRCELEDWLLPVLYRNDVVDLSFRVTSRPAAPPVGPKREPASLVGRDGELLQLERALRRRPAAIVVHGLRGIGKTTLARGLIDWLWVTGGLVCDPIWLPVREIASFDDLLERMEQELGGMPEESEVDRKIDRLTNRLRGESRVIVWDGFGAFRTRPTARLDRRDRDRLRRFLRGLRGGKTKVLITSRDPEAWLEEERQPVPLRGLAAEERWLHGEQLLEPAGIAVPRGDPDYHRLMELLRGHPSVMERALPQLASRRVEEILDALHRGIHDLYPSRRERAELDAILHFLDELPPELRPLLVPLALHEGLVVVDDLEGMAEDADSSATRVDIDRLMTVLVGAGLAHQLGTTLFELHPVLTPLLRAEILEEAHLPTREAWAEAFVGVKATIADELAPLQPHEQERLRSERGNFLVALAEAERSESLEDQFALLQALAVEAQNRNRFAEAGELFRQLVLLHRVRGDERNEAAAYHQLGMIAEEERLWKRAEHWYGKSLALKEKLGDERRAATTCHQLGVIAEERQDPDAAGRWYQKALEIRQRIGDEPGLASTYHQLGILNQKADRLAAAESWYRKALAIKERLGGEGLASTYHQLGMLAEKREDFPAAARSYRKSLRLSRRSGNRYGMALTCHQLGSVCDEQGELDASESWYMRAIHLFEELGHRHHAAVSYSMLAIAVARQGKFVDASAWLIKAILELELHDDPEREAWCQENYLLFYEQAPEDDQVSMRTAWQEALGEWPLDEGGASLFDGLS